MDRAGRLSLLIEPIWSSLALPEHREYIEALFEDLIPRSSSDAENLFAQLCSLNAGPLITKEVKQFEDLNEVQREVPVRFSRLI